MSQMWARRLAYFMGLVLVVTIMLWAWAQAGRAPLPHTLADYGSQAADKAQSRID